MAEKQKQYNLSLDPNKVMGANISRYSDGYSYANMSFKMSDSERMNVSYEWQGSEIPEFAMSVMEIMKSLGKEKASLETEDGAELLERLGKMCLDQAAKVEKKKEEKKDSDGFPFKKKKKDDEEDDEDMKKEGKKKDSKKC